MAEPRCLKPEIQSPFGEPDENSQSRHVGDVAPTPHKKRRITVTAEREAEKSNELQASESEIESDNNPLTSYLLPFTSPIGKISRLGQAFAHRKRHHQILMMALSLALLLLCITAYLLGHFKSRQPETEVAHNRPLATTSDLNVSNSETTNDQRLDEHRGLWGLPGPTSPPTQSGGSLPVGNPLPVQATAIYPMGESPDKVMQYVPGDRKEGTALGFMSQASRENLEPLPQSTEQGTWSSMTQLRLNRPTTQLPLAQQTESSRNPLHQPNSQSLLPAGNPTANVLSGSQITAWNVLSSQVNLPLSSQSTPSQKDSTIYLIDRGNVPSVDKFINPTLPAVQPPTWGEENNVRRTESADRAVTIPLTTSFLPLPTPIEQASFTTYPQRGANARKQEPLPLIEMNWNETQNGGFEQIADASQVHANHNVSPPLRLPENNGLQMPDIRLQERVTHARLDVLNANVEACILWLDADDLVLVRDTPETEWSWLPVSKPLANDIVLIPAPFRAAFMFPNGIVVETEGDTRVQIQPKDEAGRPTLAFDCGHLVIHAPRYSANAPENPSLRIVTPVGGGVLRFTDTKSYVSIDSENKTTVKLLKVTRPYESVTANPLLNRGNLENNLVYCPNLMSFPAEGKALYWQKDGCLEEWKLPTVSIFPLDVEKSIGPVLLYSSNNLIVAPVIVWPSLVSHDGQIPISKLDLKNQFVTMPHTFYPTPAKTWLLK